MNNFSALTYSLDLNIITGMINSSKELGIYEIFIFMSKFVWIDLAFDVRSRIKQRTLS